MSMKSVQNTTIITTITTTMAVIITTIITTMGNTIITMNMRKNTTSSHSPGCHRGFTLIF
ncbi:hypothetical protein [Helicobacter suis]|uniref:hypothetical protein n=2 Tax=Helicobacter suis TaxID=104628 RepID=UPI001F3D69EE|nr:hypothetical protein [Helicobacter suis]